MQAGKSVEVYTPDGLLICRLCFLEREASPVTGLKPADRSSQPTGKEGGRADVETMTGPQRRLLFRLFAIQGIEAEQAHEELKRRFRVNSLHEVPKRDASKVIEQLLEAQGGHGDGTPV